MAWYRQAVAEVVPIPPLVRLIVDYAVADLELRVEADAYLRQLEEYFDSLEGWSIYLFSLRRDLGKRLQSGPHVARHLSKIYGALFNVAVPPQYRKTRRSLDCDDSCLCHSFRSEYCSYTHFNTRTKKPRRYAQPGMLPAFAYLLYHDKELLLGAARRIFDA